MLKVTVEVTSELLTTVVVPIVWAATKYEKRSERKTDDPFIFVGEGTRRSERFEKTKWAVRASGYTNYQRLRWWEREKTTWVEIFDGCWVVRK